MYTLNTDMFFPVLRIWIYQYIDIFFSFIFYE